MKRQKGFLNLLLVGAFLVNVIALSSLAVPAIAAGEVSGFFILADFESGVPAGFVAFADSWDGSGSSTTLSMETTSVDLPTVPGAAGNTAVSVTYDIAASGGWGGGPGYGGVVHDLAPAQDWTSCQSFSFWFHGSNSGADMRVELKSDGGDATNSNRYEYTFTDDVAGWRFFNIAFDSFTRRYDYNPGPSPDDPINLAKMWGYGILLPGGASGSFYLDQVAVTSGAVLADFESGVPAGFVPFADSWDGSGSSTTLSMETTSVDLPAVPGAAGNTVVSVTYDIAASGGWGGGPGYGGVVHDLAPAQDWTSYQSFSFWFHGSNSGADMRMELKSDGGDATNSNRYEYTFTDNVAGWRFFNIAFDSFTRRYDYNPGPSPDDPINLTKMWGYGILLPGGASGSFYLDQVMVFGAEDGNGPEPPLPPGGPVDVIDDFESGLPEGTDGDGNAIGFFTFQDASGSSVAISTTSSPPDPVPDKADPNNVLQVDTSVVSGGWAGLVHAFENEAFDTWTPQDWSGYQGFSLWLYGNNTGKTLFLDILDNRAPGSTTDTAERFSIDIVDDFDGWQLFQIPFTDFHRKEIGNGAPNDGFTLTEVHGWAFGVFDSALPFINYLDDVGLYGVAEVPELTVSFSQNAYDVTEGETAAVTVKLNRPMGEVDDPEQVTVSYSTADGTATGGRDYTPASGSFTFVTGGPSEQTFIVPTVDNDKYDGDKTIVLYLSDPAGAPLGPIFKARIDIEDDESFDPTLIDDFEKGIYLWDSSDNVILSNPEITADDPLALPDQGAYEGMLSVTAPLAVAIDVDGNLCNSGNGVVPVVLLTTEDFDATSVDHTTVTLGSAHETHIDKKTGEPRRHEEDADGDGDLDLVFHFRFDETGLPCALDVVPFNGWTFDGQPITAGGAEARFERDFALGENWASAEGLEFWYYGQNSGDTITLELLDNRALDPGPAGWNLVWSDEFDDPAGTLPNSSNWMPEIGDGTINANPGWGNAELEYYTDSAENAAMDGEGNLVITAKEADGSQICYYGPCEYTSARLISWHKAEFAYGRIEARLQVPFGQGLWPAFWTLGTDIGKVGWPQSGELDIMEHIGREPTMAYGTVHGPGYSGGAGVGAGYEHPEGQAFADDFHIFAVEWEPDEIRWYVDGNQFFAATPDDVSGEWVFDHPFFVILNVAVGGNWPGYPDETTTFPQTMMVDYVRVYQGPDTAERFEATFTDDLEGWQQVSIPFDGFVRSAEQPAGAPDDGLGLTEVWGYGFRLPDSGTIAGSLLLDQVRVAGEPEVTGVIIDDFEAGVPASWFQYGDYGSGTSITPSTLVVTDRPGGVPSTSVLSVDYVSAGWGAGTGRDLVPPQDWSAHDGLSFWFQGSNSGTTYELILSDNKSDPSQDTAERFHATFTDDFAGWQHISLPWDVFYRGAWQPPGAPDDGLTLTEMWAYAMALPSGTGGTFYMDDVALYVLDTVDDFEAGVPASWFQYGDYGSGTSITPSTLVVTDRPGGIPSTSVLSIDYVSEGWGAGIGRDLVPPQDWSAHDGFSFWFQGSNSSTTYELILSDNKSDPSQDTAERFHATFTDDFAGWQHISLPWDVFYRGAWQPPGAPDDGLTLTEMWAYAIALPSGTGGTFYMDDLALVK